MEPDAGISHLSEDEKIKFNALLNTTYACWNGVINSKKNFDQIRDKTKEEALYFAFAAEYEIFKEKLQELKNLAEQYKVSSDCHQGLAELLNSDTEIKLKRRFSR